MERRQVILGTTAVIAGVSGCSALSSQSAMLGFTFFNQTDSPYTIELGVFQSDGDSSRSDVRVYDESIDVEPQGEAQRESVAETQPYLIRYSIYENNNRQTDQDHVHYYPADNGDEDTVTFDIISAGALTRR